VRLSAVLLVLNAIVQAQQAGSQGPQSKTEKATLEGRVVSGATGEPIVRAMVVVRPRVQSNDPENQPAGFEMETDEGGTFHFEKLDPGKYDLTARKSGYLRTNYGARRVNGPGIPIDLQPGQTLSDIAIKMPLQAVISGTVTDDHGEPVDRCNIQLVKRGWLRGRPGLMSNGNATTDSQGSFNLAQVEPGKYYLRADCSNGSWGREPQMVDRQGTPIRQRLVLTYFGDTPGLDGASLIQVQLGQDLTGISVRLRREPVYHIKGRINSVPAGDSSLNYYLYLMSRSTLNFFSMGGGGTRPRQNGQFELENVQPGPYQLMVTRGSGMARQFPVQVEVSGDIENLDISIPPPLEVHGRVILEGEPKGELSTIQLSLIGSAAMFGSGGAIVSSDGSFTFQNVSPDRYELAVRFPGEDAFVKSIRVGQRDMPGTSLDLTQSVGPVEVLISLFPAKVEGSVTREDPDGKGELPASAVTVALIPEKESDDFWGGVRTGSTDSQGHFTFKSLKPGKYRAVAAEGIDYGQWADPELLKSLGNKVVELDLAEKQSTLITLKLITVDEASQALERLGL
jgi:protocatechuate 3,4-dioxygenase beta subunit